MTVLLPAWLQSGTYSAELDRQIISGLGYPAGASGLVPVGGVLRGLGGEMTTTQTSTASMQVAVGSGCALVVGSYSQSQGTYVVTNDGAVNLSIAAASASQPRIDLVALQVLDSAYSGSTDLAQLIIVQGTPATSPAAPSTPASAIALARVTVPANATSIVNGNIADVRPFAVASGGIRPVQSTDVAAGAYVGQYRDHPTLGLQRWGGSTWASPTTSSGGWTTSLNNTTYRYDVPGNSTWTTIPNSLISGVVVGLGRNIDIEFMVPRIQTNANGSVYVRLLINGVVARLGEFSNSGLNVFAPCYLNASYTGTGSAISYSVQTWGFANAGSLIADGGAVTLRHRIW